MKTHIIDRYKTGMLAALQCDVISVLIPQSYNLSDSYIPDKVKDEGVEITVCALVRNTKLCSFSQSFMGGI